jgi:PAS domain S-box-containing protein
MTDRDQPNHDRLSENDRQMVVELKHRSDLFRFITKTSSIFMDLRSRDVEVRIQLALRETGEFVGVDRSYIFRLSEDGKNFTLSHEWCAPGAEPASGLQSGLETSAIPWIMDKLHEMENIHIPRVADLPPEAGTVKDILETQKTRSLLIVPMIYGRSLVGFIGFDSIKEEKTWDKNIISLMRLVSEVLTNDLEQQRREDTLSESEEMFRTVADSAKDAIIVMDNHGRIAFWNNAAESIFGYSNDEVMGKNLHKLLGPGSYYQDYKNAFLHFQKTGKGNVVGKTVELPAVRKNGEDFPMELSVSAINLRGKWHAVGILRDVTKRKWADAKIKDTVKELETSQSDLISILNNLDIGTALFDGQGRITFLSLRGEALTGLESDKVLMKSWEEVLPFPKEYVDKLRKMVEKPSRLRSRVPVSWERASGERSFVDVEVKDDPRDTEGKILFLYDTFELQSLRQLLDDKTKHQDIIGKSKSMQVVFEQIQQLCEIDTTVLIEGDTGTGKELVARALHFGSRRKDNPFVAVNCSGLTDSVLHSQLFGHKRGSFTGAVEDHRGVFEVANKGTVFLDEIAGISPSVQANLLRVLEEREITPLGATQPRRIDVRIIAASNQDLNEEVSEGTFRPDLLYRIRVARILLPDLRNRREDIPLLARFFLGQSRATSGKAVESISTDALNVLMGYRWPGNVRELKNAIEFAAIRCRQTVIQPEDLPPELHEYAPLADQGSQPEWQHQTEQERLEAALKHARGNRSLAARMLGISRATLYRKLAQLKEAPPEA